MLQTLLHIIAGTIAILTASSVLIHDAHIDKVTLSSIQSTNDSKFLTISTSPHTHSDRQSLSQAVRDIKGANTQVHPRIRERKNAHQRAQFLDDLARVRQFV